MNWYRSMTNLFRTEWNLRPDRNGELLASVLKLPQPPCPGTDNVMWTTFGAGATMGYEPTLAEAKAAAIAALVIQKLEET
jgi:hypothetical protein